MTKVFFDTPGDREDVYTAAEKWREQCLVQDGSILFEGHTLWTNNNLHELRARFIENPSYEADLTFDQKFKLQLQGASPAIYQLAMEVIYSYYLFPYSKSVSFRTKKNKLLDIASWGRIEFDVEQPIMKGLELGIGATGTYYSTAKFEEVSFIIQYAINLKQKTEEQRRQIIESPWELKELVLATKKQIGKNVQMQHTLTHLIAPAYFECMASTGHKNLIVEAFQQYVTDAEADVDYKLYTIRQALEAKGIPDVNFYHNQELYEKWHPSYKATDGKPTLSATGGGGSRVVEPQPDYPIKKSINKPIEVSGLGNLVFEEDGSILADQIQTALRTGKHIIFTGPPGTGKSKLASEVCRQVGVASKLVTATSNWTTYDTIGGYKPTQDGQLFFDPGLFLQCFKDAQGQSMNNWLIIDEINRADIDKAFGPLFSVLTGDETVLPFKAENGEQIVLKHERKMEGEVQSQEYVVPEDWRIIGTMNTIDKSSLFEMSYAFMRRFAFIPVSVPKTITPKLMEQYLQAWSIYPHPQVEELTKLWSIINKYRKFGPAIMLDIANYTLESEDLTSAIILYVLPQFEGLSDYIIKEFITEVQQLLGDSDGNRLLDFIEDFFQIGMGNE